MNSCNFIEVTEKNKKEAIDIQQKIFPKENGKRDIIDSIKKTWPQRQFMQKYWLVKVGDNFVGIIGLYAFNDYPKDAWLGWFGILPEYRQNGYGKITFEYAMSKAHKLGFDTLRLYTDKEDNNVAIERIYKKNGFVSEPYTNEKGLYYYKSETLIFSKNLRGQKTQLWNNKLLYLVEHESKNQSKKLKYVELNKKNIKIAGRIQFDVFNNHNMCGYADYLDEIKIKNRLKKRILPLNYLVYYEKEPIGLIGLYEIDGRPDDIFLNWFCVWPEYRMNGFGTQMLAKIIEIAKLYNKKYFRLFTSPNWHKAAQRIYKRSMELEENYNNKKDSEYQKQLGWECKVFGVSLCDEPIKKWNSKYIGLKEEYELNEKSIELLKRDGII